MANYLDVDRTLWYLASEIAWTDDDSYVFKGKMDYYLYFDEVTGLMTPHEYDGNSSLEPTPATSWGVFYNAQNANYPLLNKILAAPSMRQRYLAHMRTIITEQFDTAVTNARFNAFRALVDTVVQNDPKKMYSYTQYNNEIQVLRNFVTNRKNYLNTNTEIQQVPPNILGAPYYTNGIQYQQPTDMVPAVAHKGVQRWRCCVRSRRAAARASRCGCGSMPRRKPAPPAASRSHSRVRRQLIVAEHHARFAASVVFPTPPFTL